MEGFPVLNGQQTREVVYGILNDDQRKRFENNQQLDFAYAIPGVARFRVNCFFQRGSVSAAFRLVPQEIPALDSLGVPQVLRDLTSETARLRPRHRPDRLGQEHDAGGDDRRDQPRARGPHPHDRGPDRVPAPAQKLDRQPARDRLRRARLRARPARRPAPGPRRDPGRRDARPGDDLDRADRGRDRPPRLRHPAHPVDRADRRPDHRRLPARAAGPGADPALDRPAGDRHPAAAADRRRQGPGRRLRGADPDAGDPQPDPRGQNAPDLRRPADLGRGRHADDGRRPGAPGARRQDQPRAGRTARLGAGGAEPAARRRARPSSRPAPATVAPPPAYAQREPSERWPAPRTFEFRAMDLAGIDLAPASSRPNPRPRSASSCASAA